MLGQPASSQTVCSPSRRTSDLSSVYSGPVFSLVLIHGGLRSIGVSALRTSRRRSFRPSGATVTGSTVCPLRLKAEPALRRTRGIVHRLHEILFVQVEGLRPENLGEPLLQVRQDLVH